MPNLYTAGSMTHGGSRPTVKVSAAIRPRSSGASPVLPDAISCTATEPAVSSSTVAAVSIYFSATTAARLIGIVSQYWFQRNFSSYDSSVAGVTEPTITGKNVQNRFPESANIDAPQNITTINSTERQYFFIM